MVKGFKISSASDITTPLRVYRDTYNEKGKYLGWDSFHKHYSMQLGSVTDWTGYPMSGKTQVLMEVLLNTSEWYGWRHLIYFPDVGSNIEIIADLIHKRTGKSFNPLSVNSITDAEINNEVNWITHHFIVLTKEDIKAKMTPFEFWDLAVEIKNREGLETASIDSWKDMNHNYSEYGGYAQYLEAVLPYRNQIAENNNLHLHTIIHPKLTEKEKGVRKAPVPYDLKGGSEWFNSGKNMITIHREDISGNEVNINFNKIKPRAIGQVGTIKLRFDVDRFRYYELHCGDLNVFTKKWASKQGKSNIEVKNFNNNINNQAGFGFDKPVVKSKPTEDFGIDFEDNHKNKPLPF